MDTLFIGQNLIQLNEVESTNSYAIALLKNVNPPEGTVIMTKHQTQGRGQRGSLWEAQMGQNAIFSLVLKPSFLDEKHLFYLSKCAALALYDVLTQRLNSSHFDIKIKWPNDILVNGKKIAGVLIENHFSERRVAWSVVGVGININQAVFSQALNATSLYLCEPQNHDILLAIQHFCMAFEGYYLQLKNKSLLALTAFYNARLLGLGKWIDVEMNGEPQYLFFEAVTEEGRIQLLETDGKTHLLDVKQIKWLKLNF